MVSPRVTDLELITHPAELLRLAERLRRVQKLAVDTESNSLHAYRERLCLIQFSTDTMDYLVDPLALEDLSPLAPIFIDPGIEKVFHAAEYDLICLRRDHGFEVANLFDTMLAARILGRSEVGLGSMLEAEFGVTLEKRYQRADWGQRPLPTHLLDYARLDTHYLIALRERLAAGLAERDLIPLAQEDFNRLAASHPSENGSPPGGNRGVEPWRLRGAHDLTPQQAAVLGELCRYRDEMARQQDRPLFKVFNDHTLLAIATETPRTLEQLRRLPGMSPRQVNRHGSNLLRAVQRGLKSKPIHPPRPPRQGERFSDRLEALREWRKGAAEKMGVSSDVVLPRDLMFLLAEKAPRSQDELAEVLGEAPWRLEHFGTQMLNALADANPAQA
jgi:ribonuclease D